jgi:phage gp16-like protein
MSLAFKTNDIADRNNLLAKVHIGKKALGLDDETYRDLLERETGFRSSKDCSTAQLRVVVGHLSKQGFKPVQKAFDGPAGRSLAKIRALWISGWNLGVVRDPSDAAMEAFVFRQTGIAKAQWLKGASDGAKVIDGLNAWLKRESGVNFKREKHLANYANMPGYRVCLRQWELLRTADVVTAGRTWTGNVTDAAEEMLNYARAIVPGNPSDYRHADWAKVSKALGNKLRKGRV